MLIQVWIGFLITSLFSGILVYFIHTRFIHKFDYIVDRLFEMSSASLNLGLLLAFIDFIKG